MKTVMSMRIFMLGTLLFFFSCQEPEAAKKIVDSSQPQKISISRDVVYDLEGYADEGGGDPFKLFDENAFADPRNESKTTSDFVPVTNPQPTRHAEIYFKPGRGRQDRCTTAGQLPAKRNLRV